jgi:hypothetical protein
MWRNLPALALLLALLALLALGGTARPALAQDSTLPTSTAIPSVTLTLDDALSVAPQLAQEHVARWNIGSGSAGVFWSLGILTAILSMPVLLARMARRVR